MSKALGGRGAILGAMAADAAGATLEFLGRKPSLYEVREALEMVGGGCWGTAPGQITDDGELAMSLLRALCEMKTKTGGRFDINTVAHHYLLWFSSSPFDIGGTTANGLRGGLDLQHEKAQGMINAALKNNMGSKANGALMRIAPLGVWGASVDEEQLVEAAFLDAQLTHCNPICCMANGAYTVAIRHLMLHRGAHQDAFNAAAKWVEHWNNSELIEWMNLARQDVDVGYYPMAGFVKYGFVHAFRHLYQGRGYLEAIEETLLGGGDTDTNACIVGGLLGALHGEEGIPEHMRSAVFHCDSRLGRPRPVFWQTSKMLAPLLEQLCG